MLAVLLSGDLEFQQGNEGFGFQIKNVNCDGDTRISFVSRRAKCAACVNFLSEDLILISSKSFGFGTKILTLMVLPRVVRSFQSLVKISNFNKGLGLIWKC